MLADFPLSFAPETFLSESLVVYAFFPWYNEHLPVTILPFTSKKKSYHLTMCTSYCLCYLSSLGTTNTYHLHEQAQNGTHDFLSYALTNLQKRASICHMDRVCVKIFSFFIEQMKESTITTTKYRHNRVENSPP